MTLQRPGVSQLVWPLHMTGATNMLSAVAQGECVVPDHVELPDVTRPHVALPGCLGLHALPVYSFEDTLVKPATYPTRKEYKANLRRCTCQLWNSNAWPICSICVATLEGVCIYTWQHLCTPVVLVYTQSALGLVRLREWSRLQSCFAKVHPSVCLCVALEPQFA